MAKPGPHADRASGSARADMRALPQQSCEACGRLFVATRTGRKHCSGRCRAASSRHGRLRRWLEIRSELDRLFDVSDTGKDEAS
jgi:hypothetical protein